MIKYVAHEVPICLLEQSRQYNNYEYILPHLLDKFSAYKDYMLQAKKDGRYIIMDNSLHELGVPYNDERLLFWLNELKPNEFIVPDLWENSHGTGELATKWSKIELDSNITKVVVIQAKSYEQARFLYLKAKDIGYKKFAFSYGAEYYNKICPHPNRNLAKALGRLNVVSNLYGDKIITNEDRVHILGCQVPQEFGWYDGMEFIESIDTSNPIMAGYDELWYQKYGLNIKPKTKIDEIVNISFDEIKPKLYGINYNIKMFKQINNLHHEIRTYS